MNTYLLALGWWNLIGSIMMIGFFYEPFGRKMLNEWTKIFVTPFTLSYWSKLWLFWAIGLNIFFALINILAVKWNFTELKIFTIQCDIAAYLVFIALCLWGIKAKQCASGIYAAILIFLIWISWGLWVLNKNL